MELKDLVLSTLQELDEKIENDISQKKKIKKKISSKLEQHHTSATPESKDIQNDDEVAFLKHSKERLRVLFEGLKSQEIDAYEQKLELTMQYLQLHLAQIEKRLEEK